MKPTNAAAPASDRHKCVPRGSDTVLHCTLRVMEDYCCTNLTGYRPLNCGPVDVHN